MDSTEPSFADSEVRARHRAKAAVCMILEDDASLDKIELILRQNKANLLDAEEKLKRQVDSQLENVHTALEQCKVFDVAEDMKYTFGQINAAFAVVSKHSVDLGDIQGDCDRYRKILSSLDNIRQVVTVEQKMDTISRNIEADRLLESHFQLAQLEYSRDCIITNLNADKSNNMRDIAMIQDYFSRVEELTNQLYSKITWYIGRLPEGAKTLPEKVVSCLRIVEREEHFDKVHPDFNNRPRNLKQRLVLQPLERKAENMVEGLQIDTDRSVHENWFKRYLTNMSKEIRNCLVNFQNDATVCFPPEYDIINTCVGFYHRAITERLNSMAHDLTPNETAHLLQWSHSEYLGSDLFGNPGIKADLKLIGPPLSPEVLAKCDAAFLKETADNYHTWLTNNINLERENEWMSSKLPELSSEGYFFTFLMNDCRAMCAQGSSVAKAISERIFQASVDIQMKALVRFAKDLKAAYISYRDIYLKQRTETILFVPYTIAIANNCESFERDVMKGLSNEFEIDSKQYAEVVAEIMSVGDVCCTTLIHLMRLDCECYFDVICKREWLGNEAPLASTIPTIADYFVDFVHMNPAFTAKLADETEMLILNVYMSQMLGAHRRLKDERRDFATQLKDEADQLTQLFSETLPQARIQPPLNQCDMTGIQYNSTNMESIKSCAEVLREDKEMLWLSVGAFVKKNPDMKELHLTRLLQFRGDVSAEDVREMTSQAMEDISKVDGLGAKKRFFSRLKIS